MTEETKGESRSEKSEARKPDALTPAEIVAKHRAARGGITSRTRVAREVRADLEKYHRARDWSEPSDEKVDELVRDILA